LRAGAKESQPTSRGARNLLRRLRGIRAGAKQSSQYQHWVRDAFLFLFGGVLKEPRLESRTLSGTLRRDITFRNTADSGPWGDWKTLYRIDLVVIECKNADDVTNDDLRQTASYLGKHMGRLGILACRKNSGADVGETLNSFVNNDEKYILIVNDENLTDWIRLKDRGEDPSDAISDVYRSLRERAQ